jgi:hypothetical protein
MKRLLAAMLLILPVTSMADHLDVIEVRLKESCTFSSYLAIAKDFNEWGKANGYQAEVLMPLQRSTLDTVFWVGRSANAAAFGKAWDTWRDALGNPDSVPAKLWARLAACSTNVSRTGYDTY